MTEKALAELIRKTRELMTELGNPAERKAIQTSITFFHQRAVMRKRRREREESLGKKKAE